jgi:predicted methyltransferase
MMMKKFLMTAAAIGLMAQGASAFMPVEFDKGNTAGAETVSPELASSNLPAALDHRGKGPTLAQVLDSQSEDNKARYQYRHPKETIEFFGIKPGMTVVDTLPGGGYYSQILLPYLGEDGHVIGADYSVDMWGLFGGFADADFLEKKKTWPATWTKTAEGWRGHHDADVSAFALGSMPDELAGTVDVFMFVRALHHLNRFEDEGDYFTKALQDVKKALKSGGIIGVVQHSGPEGNDDKWAEGDNGYLKQSQVIAFMEKAGFEFVASSDVNANPKDVPGNEDFVWRLPPSLATSRSDADLKAKMQAIGESNRMTLKFRKP